MNKTVLRDSPGFNGVSKDGEKFRAQIYYIDGKNKHLGYFTRARDAAMAYDEAIVTSNVSSTTHKVW